MSAHFEMPNTDTANARPVGLSLLMRAMEDAMGPRNNSPYKSYIQDGKDMRPGNKIVEVVAAAPKAVVAAAKHIMPPSATMPKAPEAPLFRTRRAA